MNSLARLQALAAEFSGALTVEDIAGAIVKQGVKAMDAGAGGMVLLSVDGSWVYGVSSTGYVAELSARLDRLPLELDTPVTVTVRTGEPAWLDSEEDWSRYADVHPMRVGSPFKAGVCVPLAARGRVLGALTFSFVDRREFTEDYRGFALVLAALCAQALDRAQLYEGERKARALAESQRQRLEAIFEAAPARIAMARGPDHIYEFANSKYVQFLEDKDIVGKPAREVFPGAESQGLIGEADHVYQTGEPAIHTEAPFWDDHDGDGIPEEHYFNVALLPMRDADGETDGVMLFTVDVTEHVLARRRVEELAAHQSAILSQAAEGIAIVDEGGHLEFLNDVARDVIGEGEPGAPVESHPDIFHIHTVDGRRFPADELPIARALRNRETVLDYPLLIRRSGTADRIVEVNAAPVVTEDGTLLGVVATFRDVTAQRQLQRQKDDFLAAVSHDLRTPLTTIKGLAQMATRRAGRIEGEDGEKLVETLTRIDATATKMNLLIGKLLDLTRLQMNESLMLNPSPFDLLHLLRAVIAEHQVATTYHGIELRTELDEMIGVWDAQRIERVFANLLSNAVKYSPLGGTVVVAVTRQLTSMGEAAVVTVEDPGIGIPEDAMSHIFDRFYRASNVDPTIPGAGIGLSGVRQIVEQHGGSISVHSEVGMGSRFEVVLPLQRADASVRSEKKRV